MNIEVYDHNNALFQIACDNGISMGAATIPGDLFASPGKEYFLVSPSTPFYHQRCIFCQLKKKNPVKISLPRRVFRHHCIVCQILIIFYLDHLTSSVPSPFTPCHLAEQTALSSYITSILILTMCPLVLSLYNKHQGVEKIGDEQGC